MSYLEKFLEGILEELHDRFDGLPLERIKKEARELLEEELLDLDATLELFLERLGVCRRCGNAWPTWDMEEREGPEGPSFVCESCSGGAP
jgi:hypothetical protein